ncbi:MAG: M48 family metalloprotease [Planctomycetota bacterium]
MGPPPEPDLAPASECLAGLLPSGILLWNPVALALGCALAAALGTWLACAWTSRHRRGGPHPWPESARRNHPLALALAIAPLALPAAALPIAFALQGGLAPWPGRVTLLVCFLSGWFASQFVAWPYARRLRAGLGFWRWQLVQLVGIAFLKPLLPVVLAMALVVPVPFGPGSWLTLALGAAALTFALSKGMLGLWQRVGVLHPASSEVRAEIEGRAARCGARVGGAWVLDMAQANGFALFGPRALVLTGPLLELLDPQQRRTIIDHELAHLAEPRSRQLLFLSRSYCFLPFGLLPALLTSLGPWGGLVPPVLGLFLVIVSSRMHRGLEERADEQAVDAGDAERTGRVYATALIELYRWNDAPAVLGKKGGHPDLVDRVEAAGLTWEGPRPEPPPKSALGEVLLPVGLALAGFLVGGQQIWTWAMEQRWAGPEGALQSLRWAGGDSWALSELAIDAGHAGRGEEALRFALASWSLWRAGELSSDLSDWEADSGWLALGLAGSVVGRGAEHDAWSTRWLDIGRTVRERVPGDSAEYYDADLGLLAADLGDFATAQLALERIELRGLLASEASEDPWGLARLAALCAALGQTERSNGFLRQARAAARDDLDDAQGLEEFWGELAGRPGGRAARAR